MKKFLENNKVLIVLGITLVICVIAILIVVFSFFLGGGKSLDGLRAQDISSYPITNENKNKYISALKENDEVIDVSFSIKENKRTVYIEIDFKEDTALDDAKSKTLESISNISEKLLSYYDFEFLIKCNKSDASDGFTLFGARNVAGSGLVWNNNTPVESD